VIPDDGEHGVSVARAGRRSSGASPLDELEARAHPRPALGWTIAHRAAARATILRPVRARETPHHSARLLVRCADRPGIVSAVSGLLYEEGANIVSSNQWSSDPTGGSFFLRLEFFLEEFDRRRAAFEARFDAEVAQRFGMDWELRAVGERRRLAILVSRYDHCLVDLLTRWRHDELEADITRVISNHLDLEREAHVVGVPFHHVPVPPGGKAQAEARMLELLGTDTELVVLARYMQILSGDFLARVAAPVINIHHSFLPAFAGADPYERARERGVKLIGATAHYVTEELDAGPIIEQDVMRVDHRQSTAELERTGRDVERIVLARAVAAHLDDRVIVDGARTVVF
jgi:formyltetrahydrofolate deformylase